MRNALVYTFAIVTLGLGAIACGGSDQPADDGGQDAHVGIDAHVEQDAGGGEDAQVGTDAHVEVDAFVPDVDAGDDGGAIDDAGALVDAARVCMIGQVCGDTQPCPDGASFTCYGDGLDGFCAPGPVPPSGTCDPLCDPGYQCVGGTCIPRTQCGGFAIWRCDPTRTCIRGGGGSIGYCATDEEMDCICTSAVENHITVDGCPDSYFPDAGAPPR